MSIDGVTGGLGGAAAGFGQASLQGDDDSKEKPEAKSTPQERSVKDTFG
jgi:hypothetical protein